MRHLDKLTGIYSRWLKANALPELSPTELTIELWSRYGGGRESGGTMRKLRMREQLAWLDRFCYLWQMAEASPDQRRIKA